MGVLINSENMLSLGCLLGLVGFVLGGFFWLLFCGGFVGFFGLIFWCGLVGVLIVVFVAGFVWGGWGGFFVLFLWFQTFVVGQKDCPFNLMWVFCIHYLLLVVFI